MMSRHIRGPMGAGSGSFLVGVALVLAGANAAALTHVAQLDGLDVTIYAPDWTWQNRYVNILAVCANRTGHDVEAHLALVLPESEPAAFAYGGPCEVNVAVPAQGSVRHAFTNILALPAAPRGEYEIALVLSSGSREARVPYAVRTIRGEVFTGRWMALVVPPALALIWCVAFVLVLRRFAAPGAWRTPSPAVEDPEVKETWIEQTPQ